MATNYALDPNTPLKLVATHKRTTKEFTKTITFHEWQTLTKHKDYYYKCYQV